MNDETEIPIMPLSHRLFPFLLILCFISFLLSLFPITCIFPYFDLTYLFLPFPLLSSLHVSVTIFT